jgi:tetratricopeptide (TPR) repeat protein
MSLALTAAMLAQTASPARASTSTGEIEKLQRITMENPGRIKDLYKLGVLYFLNRRFDDAIEAWTRILANRTAGLSTSSKVKVAKNLALANYKLTRLPQAFKYIKWAFRHQPEDPKISRAYDVIRKAYEAWIKAPPPDRRGTDIKTPPSPASPSAPPPPDAATAKKAFEKGEQSFKEGEIAVDAGTPDSDYEKKFTQSIREMQVAVNGKHNLPKALYFLGSAHMLRQADETDDLQKAKEYLERSLKEDTDIKTLYNLGRLYGLLDDKEKEIKHYEAALEMNPKWADCHFRLALAYDKSKRPDAARKTFEHAKAAIREKSDYKKKFQEVLKNSDVAKQIAGIVSEIIEKSENDQLTDDETEKYAQRFQQMLGERRIDPADLRDRGKMQELLNRDDVKGIAGNNADKIKDLLNNPKIQERLNRHLSK